MCMVALTECLLSVVLVVDAALAGALLLAVDWRSSEMFLMDLSSVGLRRNLYG